jgi:hypothetical protein
MKKTILYILYWIGQCTWGLPVTLIGGITALILLITGHKPKTLGPNIYFEVGQGWGGLELGGFFLCSKDSSNHTKYHEAGHGLQNLIWGPLFPFLIMIPSAIRYWLRKMDNQLKKGLFNLFFLLISFTITTGIIILFGLCCHWHWATHLVEALRLYFVLISMWLTICEIPKYALGYVPYDDVWFEGQASKWGHDMLDKKDKKED